MTTSFQEKLYDVLATCGVFIPSSLPTFSVGETFTVLPRTSQGISFEGALPPSSPHHTPPLSLFSLALQKHVKHSHQGRASASTTVSLVTGALWQALRYR